MNRRRRNRGNDDDEQLGNHSVPFQDASPELGEIPLDDIDTFVIPARDEKGAYTTVHLNFPPHMYRQMQIVVKSGRFPYLDVSDFVRHAAFRHLHFCVDIRESIPKSVYTATEAMMEVSRDNELRLRVASAFEEIDRQITGHMDRLEIADAIRLLTILKNRIDVVPHSPRQFQVRAGILRRFGYVLEHNGDVRSMTDKETKEAKEANPEVGQPGERPEGAGESGGTKSKGYQ
jgi:Arc/MetJ-type ribon-helix-helix transcriptional regulator